MAKHDRASQEKQQRNLKYAIRYQRRKCKQCGHCSCVPGKYCKICGGDERKLIPLRSQASTKGG